MHKRGSAHVHTCVLIAALAACGDPGGESDGAAGSGGGRAGEVSWRFEGDCYGVPFTVSSDDPPVTELELGITAGPTDSVWRFYLRTFYASDGEMRIQPLSLTVSSDAEPGEYSSPVELDGDAQAFVQMVCRPSTDEFFAVANRADVSQHQIASGTMEILEASDSTQRGRIDISHEDPTPSMYGTRTASLRGEWSLSRPCAVYCARAEALPCGQQAGACGDACEQRLTSDDAQCAALWQRFLECSTFYGFDLVCDDAGYPRGESTRCQSDYRAGQTACGF
jgi:hypothetical protein